MGGGWAQGCPALSACHPPKLQSERRMNHSIIGSFTTGDQKYASVTEGKMKEKSTFFSKNIMSTLNNIVVNSESDSKCCFA